MRKIFFAAAILCSCMSESNIEFVFATLYEDFKINTESDRYYMKKYATDMINAIKKNDKRFIRQLVTKEKYVYYYAPIGNGRIYLGDDRRFLIEKMIEDIFEFTVTKDNLKKSLEIGNKIKVYLSENMRSENGVMYYINIRDIKTGISYNFDIYHSLKEKEDKPSTLHRFDVELSNGSFFRREIIGLKSEGILMPR